MGWIAMLYIIFTISSFLCGVMAAFTWKAKKPWRWVLLCVVLGIVSVSYYDWYALAYVDHGNWALWLAYLAVGYAIGTLLALLPLFILFLLCHWKKLHPLRKLVPFLFLFIICAGVYGSVDGNQRLEVEHYDVYSENVPAVFDGYKVALMADTHIGPYFRYYDLDPELERAHQEGADMVAFSGDLIDDVRFMPETAAILTRHASEFPDGIFYTWGNHEYYRNKPLIEKYLRETPVRWVVNSHQAITRNGETLYVAGADFPFADEDDRLAEEERMADEAYAGIPAGAPSLFMAHHSDFIRQGCEHGAILTLTGHTHGTQIGFLGKPLFTPFIYTRGMYEDERGHLGYVTRGDASWLPFRLGCPRELTIFTLHRGQAG